MTAPLERWVPTKADPFDLPAAGHVLRRVALGATLRQRLAAVRAGVDATLDDLLAAPAGAAPVDELFADVVAMGDIERVRAWRVWRLLTGPHRLRERMSLLWHGHFATADSKVMHPPAMARQMDLFDRLGLGVFDELALGVSQDPAMLRYLDSDANVAGSPNENFARELFELFTLGVSNYTEADVQEAARAFTGWRVRDGRFYFDRRRHDGGPKRVLGTAGTLGGEDVVRLAVASPASARFLATRLLRWFVHPEPLESEVEAVASCYTAQGRHLGRTLGVLLRSRLFFSARARRSMVASPLEHLVTVVRSLGRRTAPARLARTAAELGENLLEPPSVAGWPSGEAWVHPTAWRQRSNALARLLSTMDPQRLVDGDSPERRLWQAKRLLLDGDPDAADDAELLALARSPAGRGPGGASALLHAVAVLPRSWLW